MDVLKKMDYRDFARFKQCSTETVALTNNFKDALPLKMQKIDFCRDYVKVKTNVDMEFIFDHFRAEPFRFETSKLCIYSRISKDFSLEDFLKNRLLKVDSLVLSASIDPSTFGNLIKIFNVRSLMISRFNPSSLISQPELKNVDEIEICELKLEEDDFPLLEVPQISIRRTNGLTLHAINKFFMQWVKGKRRIETLRIDSIPREHSGVFEELDVQKTCIGLSESTKLNIYSLRRDDGRQLFVGIKSVTTTHRREDRLAAGESDSLNTFLCCQFPGVRISDSPATRTYHACI